MCIIDFSSSRDCGKMLINLNLNEIFSSLKCEFSLYKLLVFFLKTIIIIQNIKKLLWKISFVSYIEKKKIGKINNSNLISLTNIYSW